MLRLNLEEFATDFLSRSPEARRASDLFCAISQFLEFALFAKGVGPLRFTCDDTPGSCNCFRIKEARVKFGEPIEIVVSEGHNPRTEHTFRFALNLVEHKTTAPAPREPSAVGYCEKCKKGYALYPDYSACPKCNGAFNENGCPNCHRCP